MEVDGGINTDADEEEGGSMEAVVVRGYVKVGVGSEFWVGGGGGGDRVWADCHNPSEEILPGHTHRHSPSTTTTIMYHITITALPSTDQLTHHQPPHIPACSYADSQASDNYYI